MNESVRYVILFVGGEEEFQTFAKSSLEHVPRTQTEASATSPRVLPESRFQPSELQ